MSPARASGVVGFKPTVGLTSRHGVYCVSEWEDSVGVLGRSVEDAAVILSAMAGTLKSVSFWSSAHSDPL